MEYKYLIIDANNLGYKVLNRDLDRSLLKISNKFIYGAFVKNYIETISYLKNKFGSEEVILLFDNHTSKEELKKAFKLHQGTTRKDIKETYKSNRKKESNEFYESLNFIKYYYMIGDSCYHTAQVFKLEADDLVKPCLDTIVRKDSALLVTNDMDWARYLSDKIHYLPKDEPVDEQIFFELHGYVPSEEKIILDKLLFGDSSDNITPVFPEIKNSIRKQILNDFDSIFDVILYNSSKEYLKEFTSLIKDRELDIKINYQLLSSIEVTNENFLSHYTTGRNSSTLKNAVLEILYGKDKVETKFEFGGIKVPRVTPKSN